MFEAEGSNLQFKFVDRTASEKYIMFLGAVFTDAFCWGTVCTGMARWGKEGNVQWIYSILLNVQISSSFGTDWGKNVRFNLTEGHTYVYIVWKILYFECKFCNICWVPAVATRVNGKAGHRSDIILICKGD